MDVLDIPSENDMRLLGRLIKSLPPTDDDIGDDLSYTFSPSSSMCRKKLFVLALIESLSRVGGVVGDRRAKDEDLRRFCFFCFLAEAVGVAKVSLSSYSPLANIDETGCEDDNGGDCKYDPGVVIPSVS